MKVHDAIVLYFQISEHIHAIDNDTIIQDLEKDFNRALLRDTLVSCLQLINDLSIVGLSPNENERRK